METKRETTIYRVSTLGKATLLLCMGLLAGCALSGDVEQVRKEREQAKAKMRAELQQERTLAQSMEQESEARKSEAEKLAAALGGGAAAKPRMGAALSAMSLTTALATGGCQQPIAANPPNPAVPAALFINSTTSCSNVTISASDTATFTASSPLIPVVVGSGGTLTLNDPGSGNAMTLYASSFLIQNTGTMSAGSVSTPVAGQITIAMAGNQSAVLPPTTNDQNPNMRDITVMDGGVLQLYGGKGLSAPPGSMNNDIVSGTKSWTYLAVPAGPAKYSDAENVSTPVPTTTPDSILTLANQVDWQVGDWISVATTGFSSHQTEIVQICAIASVSNPDPQASALGLPANVSQITLRNGTNCTATPNNTPLKHYHYGGLAPTPGFFPAGTQQVVAKGGNAINVSYQAKSFYDNHTRNYGIDERAEVALLSRNIKLTSVAGQSGDGNKFIGGHLVAMVSGTNSPTLTLVGVEIEKFGQGLVGRYPVHLHKLPSGSGVLAQDVSVHHSYNKCYVVHGTANAKFYNNVCVRTVGQGFYLEDGDNITGNQFMRNHIAGTMAANTQYSYPLPLGSQYWDGDNLQGYWAQNRNWYNINSIPDTSQTGYNANAFQGPDLYQPSGFWITNLDNKFVNNSVAGCQANGRGYWLLSQGASATSLTRSTYPEFTGNRAHGCYYGIDATAQDGVATARPTLTSYTYDPRPTLSGKAGQPPVFLINDNTITRSRFRGFWSRTLFTTLHNNRFATNPYGFSLLGGGGPEGNLPGFWGMAHENVIAGMTRNNVDRFPACTPPITQAQNSTNGGAPLSVTSLSLPPQNATVQIFGIPTPFQGASVNGQFTVATVSPATNTFTTTNNVNPGTATNSGVWQYVSGWTYGNIMVPWASECADVALSSSGSNLGWGNFPNPQLGSAMNIQGYSYYDGPARIEHNRFVNFRFDPTGIYPNHPEARLLTRTDMQIIVAFDSQTQNGFPVGPLGQLQGVPQLNGTNTTLYNGYAGDSATGWIQSNAQAVPPTQYIRDSIWDNVDFKHQVYTEAVNMGVFNDGDKTTVILDKDGQLSGLRVVDNNTLPAHDVTPVSLNSIDYYATDFTVDEPHSRGPNDFRATSLMSPHKYATLNIESVDNPPYGGSATCPASNSAVYYIPTCFRVVVQRDMPAYGDTVYPTLFLNGRGQNPIYEPFVMDRMGYTVYGLQGTEHTPSSYTATAFQNRLLFSYTDAAVKAKSGDFFVNRIAVYQPAANPANIKVYRIRRQWGQPYTAGIWPPNYSPPKASPSCDNTFFSMNPNNQSGGWTDCMSRATTPLSAATSWALFEQPYLNLMAGTITASQFITQQTFFYDTTNNLLYFYMIEEKPVQHGHEPYGTCGGGGATYAANVAKTQTIKNFSDPNSVQRALNVSCLVSGGTWTWGTSSSSYPITTVTNAAASGINAVVVTSLNSPPTGTQVTIAGVQGITGINTTWTVTNIDATHFSLNNSSSITSGTFTGTQPQPTDLFTCSESGCAAYLVDMTDARTTSPTQLPPTTPANPITRAIYKSWNQYHFVYASPTQQPNGVPVASNPAIGNTTPQPDGTVLATFKHPADGTPPPAGDQVTYTFLALDGAMPVVTENFRYRCVTNPPWAPVNARGTYPPTGGFTYPLAPTVCTNP